MKILISKLNCLGDCIVFLPTLKAIYENFPDTDISVITTPIGRQVFNGAIPVSRYFVYDHSSLSGIRRHPLAFLNFVRDLRKHRFDISLFSHDEISSIYLASFLSGIPTRIGISSGIARMNSLLTHKLPLETSGNVVDIEFNLARFFAQEAKPKPKRVPIYYSGNSVSKVNKLLNLMGIGNSDEFIVIHPFAKFRYKEWELARYYELAQAVESFWEIPVLFSVERLDSRIDRSLRVISDLSIKDLAYLVERALIFIGNNSGPMHVAAVMNTSTITIQGPSAPNWEVYWKDAAHIRILAHDIPCIPCESLESVPAKCLNSAYPGGCMKEVKVESVFAEVEKLLEKMSNRANKLCVG